MSAWRASRDNTPVRAVRIASRTVEKRSSASPGPDLPFQGYFRLARRRLGVPRSAFYASHRLRGTSARLRYPKAGSKHHIFGIGKRTESHVFSSIAAYDNQVSSFRSTFNTRMEHRLPGHSWARGERRKTAWRTMSTWTRGRNICTPPMLPRRCGIVHRAPQALRAKVSSRGLA